MLKKTVQIIKISVYLKDSKKVDHISESSLDVQSLSYALNVIYQLSEIKDDIQVQVSQFRCLLGHPVQSVQTNSNFCYDMKCRDKIQS